MQFYCCLCWAWLKTWDLISATRLPKYPLKLPVYNAYHDKKFKSGDGFEIFSVSLDNNKSAWIKAIEKDQLTWASHVCDYKGWYGEASTVYELESIPMNFLIDQDGIIIAKNLRGPALENKIKELVAE